MPNPCDVCNGDCCNLEVTPTPNDIKLLASGLSMSESMFRETYMNEELFKMPFSSKRKENICTFLRDDGKCRVYEYRPMVCRKFLCTTVVDWMRNCMHLKTKTTE